MIVAARYVRVAAPAGMPTKIATSITVCLAVDHRPRKVSILISFIPRDNQTVSVRQGDLASRLYATQPSPWRWAAVIDTRDD